MRQIRQFLGIFAFYLFAMAQTHPLSAAIELRGEFLYLRPSACNSSYAILTRDPEASAPIGSVKSVHADFEPGFRISVGYLDCCTRTDIKVSYTRLHQTRTSHCQTKEFEGLWPTYGRPGDLNRVLVDARAKARRQFNYDAVEIQAGHRSVHDPGFLCLKTRVGLHYVHLERTHDVEYHGFLPGDIEQSSKIHSKSRAWGIGPRIGVDLRLAVGCGFGIGGSFSAGLLAGEQKRRFHEEDAFAPCHTIPTALRFKNHFTLFTELNARLGLNYGWCCGSCCTFLVEIGYEFINYINALEVVSFTGPKSTFNVLCEDARLDGLYVFARLGF